MKRLGLTILILTSSCKAAVGQLTSYEFREGTIEKKDGSSISCLVEFAAAYYSVVAYKLTQDGKVLRIKSNEIKSIQTPYQYFENIATEGNERLMGLVTDGHIILYNYVILNTNSWSKEMAGGTATFNLAPTIIYAIKKGDNFTEIKKKDFKSKLTGLLGDQPSVVERISNGAFEFEDMKVIIDEYNDIYKKQAMRRELTVRVVDSENKNPIKNAKVKIQGTDIEATTNFLGFIQISIDTIDTLLIEHPEYEVGQVKVPEVNSFQISLTRIIKKE